MSVYNTKTVKTGYYIAINKSKLKNENKTLYYRSGLEKKMMTICDHSSKIIEWSYELVTIPYIKYDKKVHQYIMDFWLKKNINGIIKEFLVEIKPMDFLSPPKPQKRQTRKYIELVENHAVNVAKWAAADKYCQEHNMTFAIVTDKNLN